jgi:hypothetical protein
MRGKDCFLKDLKDGSAFRMKHTGGTVYTFFKDGNDYFVNCDKGIFYASPTTPVIPLIKF